MRRSIRLSRAIVLHYDWFEMEKSQLFEEALHQYDKAEYKKWKRKKQIPFENPIGQIICCAL